MKLGDLVQHLTVAAKEHGASPFSDVRVRVRLHGPVHRIKYVKGSADQRGFSMMLELDPTPESDG